MRELTIKIQIPDDDRLYQVQVARILELYARDIRKSNVNAAGTKYYADCILNWSFK